MNPLQLGKACVKRFSGESSNRII